MKKENLRKLTDEEKQKVLLVVNDLIPQNMPEELTEYDVLMEQKRQEFISLLLRDNEHSEIEALLNMCEKYIHGDTFNTLGLIMKYDMWINNSAVWPVMHNPEWEEWEKLKEKKVKQGDKKLKSPMKKKSWRQ